MLQIPPIPILSRPTTFIHWKRDSSIASQESIFYVTYFIIIVALSIYFRDFNTRVVLDICQIKKHGFDTCTSYYHGIQINHEQVGTRSFSAPRQTIVYQTQIRSPLLISNKLDGYLVCRYNFPLLCFSSFPVIDMRFSFSLSVFSFLLFPRSPDGGRSARKKKKENAGNRGRHSTT